MSLEEPLGIRNFGLKDLREKYAGSGLLSVIEYVEAALNFF